MVRDVFHFLKKPVYKEDPKHDLGHRFRVFYQLLFLAVLFSLGLGMALGMLQDLFQLDLGKHAMDLFLERFPLPVVFLAAVILAPILEELLFRGPLVFFRDSRYFGPLFYISTLIFGFYHITNFEMSREVLWLSPLLVTPQLCTGILLGYTRVRLGLGWAILLHAAYNLVLIGPLLLLEYLNTPVL